MRKQLSRKRLRRKKMIKIEAITLEEAYKEASSKLNCSITELKIEVVQSPSKGILGLFKKNAIIVVAKEPKEKEDVEKISEADPEVQENTTHTVLNDTIMPASFVSTQDEDDDTTYEPVYADDVYEEDDVKETIDAIALEVKENINRLFALICFEIDEIEVSTYDENTLLIEFKGEDAALLIGKEGYRYKALSYMIFNWINTKYQMQLRLEIAEFLQNQEESISRYLVGVCEGIDRDGRAQTKILDGVLVQIALKELRDRYPEKYVAIRSTRDGMKYIIINDYHN